MKAEAPAIATAATVRQASKAYGAVQALDRLTLDVQPGEWVGLLGPNGAGKTTLMLALAGLIELDGGTVEIFGRPLQWPRGPRPDVGFVPQEIAIYPLLTVQENLDVFGRLNGVKGQCLEQRIDWALRWTRLDTRQHQRAEELSGGMKRRLNIACGVLHRPRLVLLDEPAVGVDPQGRRRIWDMLQQLRDAGTSLIQSTHELNEIESVCDRMLILDHGSVIADGTVEQLVATVVGGGARFALTMAGSQEQMSRLRALGRAKREHGGPGFEVDGTTVRGSLSDIAQDLPRVLQQVRQGGAVVRHVRVDTPGIEEVFTQLTGRELRE